MTCGSHEPAAYSTFERRHEIERKRQVTKYQEPKIIQKKKLLLYIEYDMRIPLGSSILNVSKAAWDQKKKGNSQKAEGENNPRQETFILH
jgi:hypothetical protein